MSDPLFIPVFRAGGRRWRCRIRTTGRWRRPTRRVQHFEQGAVYRFWLGPLLLTAMAD